MKTQIQECEKRKMYEAEEYKEYTQYSIVLIDYILQYQSEEKSMNTNMTEHD